MNEHVATFTAHPESPESVFRRILPNFGPSVLVNRDGVSARARCLAHGSKSRTLAIRAGDRAVMFKCHAGCSTEAVMASVGMGIRDAFPRDESWRKKQDDLRQRMRATPKKVITALLSTEYERAQAESTATLGYARPLTSSDLNKIRERVGRIAGVSLPNIPPFDWECAPHDTDPAWATLFYCALNTEVYRRWHAFHPGAGAGETDPEGPCRYDVFRAQQVAAQALHELAAAK